MTRAQRWAWWQEIAFGRLGYAHADFYALSIREWNAALRAHRHGDGHDKTHGLLAELAAMIGTYINARAGGGHKRFAPMDFLPWRKKKSAVTEAQRIGGRKFFDKAQELKKKE